MSDLTLKIGVLAGLLLWVAICAARPAVASERTFPAGSLIIPVDPCWQPEQLQPASHGCAGGGSSAGMAGAYGLAYRLQRAGVPVYLVAGSAENEIAFVLNGQGVAPVMELPGGSALAPPSRSVAEGVLDSHLLDYRGAPFLVDTRDLNDVTMSLVTENPQVRCHQALVPFVAPVTRVLTGLPGQVAVTDDVTAARLRASLELAGLTGADGLTVIREELPAGDGARLECSADDQLFTWQEDPCSLPAIFAVLYGVATTTTPREAVSVAPLVADGTLYVASTVFPGGSGRLRAFSLQSPVRVEQWDAANAIPLPGDVFLPLLPEDSLAPVFEGAGNERLLFTNAGAERDYRLIRLDAAAAAALAPQLGSDSIAAATALISAVRGRLGTSAALPLGSGDRAERLGAISRSTPALVGPSPYLPVAGQRDRVLYVGSDSGLLHAILAGSSSEPVGTGRELWGYLPASLLPMLQRQVLGHATSFAVARVDGSPAVADQFADFDGDGRREWRTVLVGTASADGFGGVVFALDVTDPYQPVVLWEKPLDGLGIGASRGAALTVTGSNGMRAPVVFVTGSFLQRSATDGVADPYNGCFGVRACAIDLVDGTLQWTFFSTYAGLTANLNAAPAQPALMTSAGKVTWILFGDLAGRLWALDSDSGRPLNGGSIYQLPGGSSTPIAAGVAVQGRLIFFGSGGADHIDPATVQSLSAIELLPTGARLLWSMPLTAGEQLWGAPLLDRSGRLYAAVGAPEGPGARLMVLSAAGTPAGAVPLAGSPAESLALGPGVAITVSRQGAVDQVGNWLESGAGEQLGGRVRILSWRFR